MISVDEALEIINNVAIDVNTTEIPVAESLGFTIAKDLQANISLPPFAQSAMDGYALCGIHKTYHLQGEIQAGDTNSQSISLKDGHCLRIFTGAPVPSNATAVIMQEKVESSKDGQSIAIHDEVKVGKNIRPIGEQILQGTPVLKRGHKITPATIGLLLSLGEVMVSVYQKPPIGIVSTGNELIKPGNQLSYGQIFESNSNMLLTALHSKGFEATPPLHVEDDYNKTLNCLAQLLDKEQVILVSGGISVGDYDFVGKALGALGVETMFYKIKQKPGKPLFFGRKGNKFIFGLPGNPAASLTCFYVYVLPLLERLASPLLNSSGAARFSNLQSFPINQDFTKLAGKAQFLKAHIDYNVNLVSVLDGQASSMLHTFAESNALIYLPEDVQKISKNDLVQVYKI